MLDLIILVVELPNSENQPRGQIPEDTGKATTEGHLEVHLAKDAAIESCTIATESAIGLAIRMLSCY